MQKSELREALRALVALGVLAVGFPAAAEAPSIDWIASYDGTGSYDFPQAMTVDDAGFIYVVGSSYGPTDGDYITLKLDAQGNQRWAARYNGPEDGLDWVTGVEVDGAGHVFVTGYTGGGSGLVTIEYDASGVEQWVARYDGGGIPSGLALDAAGGVYVLGRDSFHVLKYTPDGALAWDANEEVIYPWASAITAGADGGIYVTGCGDNEMITRRYDASSGALEWDARYRPGRGSACGMTIAIDPAGDVVASGFAYTDQAEFATVKYSPAGTLLWSAAFRGEFPDWQTFPMAIAIDGAGDVHVTGMSDDLSVYAVVKYDAAGVELWRASHDGDPTGMDNPFGIALDDAGNVYVTGESYGPYSDAETVAFDRDGNTLWAHEYTGPEGSSDGGSAIALDPAGNLYVAGYVCGDPVCDIRTIKYHLADDTPEQQVEALQGSVAALPPATASTLLPKLAAAAASLAKGQTTTAKNQLRAFVNAVSAQRGKKLSTATADALIAAASTTIAAL